jgi:hypothetical protein
MWNDRYRDPCSVARRACFDPLTLTAVSMGATAVGGLVTGAGTIAGGNAAAAAGQMQQASANNTALQEDENASQALASGQRKMFDTQQRTRLAISTNTAEAGASGVDAGVGSPATNAGALAKRGSYNAAMDMFNGASTSTGLLNQAAATRYSGTAAAIGGQEAQDASYLTAAGTIASSAGTMAKTYTGYAYPNAKIQT